MPAVAFPLARRVSCAQSASDVSNYFLVPMVGIHASSAKLSDAERFPFFMRTVPPDTVQGGVLARLITDVLNFTHAAVLYSEDGASLAEGFKSQAGRVNVVSQSNSTTICTSQQFVADGDSGGRACQAGQGVAPRNRGCC